MCERAYGLERLKEKKLLAFANKKIKSEGPVDKLRHDIENVFTRDYELDFTDVAAGIAGLDQQIESVDIL